MLNPKANSSWFERIFAGSTYSIYASSETGSFGAVYFTSVWYVLKKPSGEFVFLETCGICPWRKNLFEFLADNPNALAALENIKAKELGVFLRSISK